MTVGPPHPRSDPDRSTPDRSTPDSARPSAEPAVDPSIVPGFPSGGVAPLDMSQDPDRYDPTRVEPAPEIPRGLDPDYDPDRFSVVNRSAGQGQSLPDLLGTAGTHEGHRDNYEWAYGLLAVLVFLGLVSFLFNNVLSP